MSKKTPVESDAGLRVSWSLCIPDFWPKGPNDLSGRHRQVIAKERTRCRDAVLGANAGHGVPRFTGRPAVQIIRLMGKRKRALDPDNAMAAVKPLVDVLRDHKGKKGQQLGLGLFPDDREQDIELRPIIQRKSADGRTWTRIVVSGEIEPGLNVLHEAGPQLEVDVLLPAMVA